MTAARWWWCTAPAPGAVAVACVHGVDEELDAVSRALTGRKSPTVGAISWRQFGFDDGVFARVDGRTLLIMPHGGARIRAKLSEALASAGAQTAATATTATKLTARGTYPEAADDLEALTLAELARAASPRAVDLLLAQPARWRKAREAGTAPTAPTERDALLARLITPPRVMVTGAANAGKSTLMNALAGRAVAVAHDQPGTTRDAVAARLDLDGIVVDWFDTPGVRAVPDEVETASARIATAMMEHADLVIVLTAPGLGWHALVSDATRAANAPALLVLNKCDTPQAASCAERAEAAFAISATRGDGIVTLVKHVREVLVPAAVLESHQPWWFSSALTP